MAKVAYVGDHQGTPIFQAVFRKHTGLLIVSTTRSAVSTGTLDQLEQAYKAAQTHNLLAGWWGVISLLVYNWISIFGNLSTRKALRELAADVANDRARAAAAPPAAPDVPGYR